MNINEAAWIQSSWMLNIKFQIAIFQKPFKIIWCGFRQSPPYWSALKYLVELKPSYWRIFEKLIQKLYTVTSKQYVLYHVIVLTGTGENCKPKPLNFLRGWGFTAQSTHLGHAEHGEHGEFT